MIAWLKLWVLSEIVRSETLRFIKWLWIKALCWCNVLRSGTSHHGESAVALRVNIVLLLGLNVLRFFDGGFFVFNIGVVCRRFLFGLFGFGFRFRARWRLIGWLGSFGMRLVVVGSDEFEDWHDGLAVGFGFGVGWLFVGVMIQLDYRLFMLFVDYLRLWLIIWGWGLPEVLLMIFSILHLLTERYLLIVFLLTLVRNRLMVW